MNLKAPRLEEGLIMVFQYADHEYRNEKSQFSGDQKFSVIVFVYIRTQTAIAIAISIASMTACINT